VLPWLDSPQTCDCYPLYFSGHISLSRPILREQKEEPFLTTPPCQHNFAVHVHPPSMHASPCCSFLCRSKLQPTLQPPYIIYLSSISHTHQYYGKLSQNKDRIFSNSFEREMIQIPFSKHLHLNFYFSY
jgi:hypothetical protein